MAGGVDGHMVDIPLRQTGNRIDLRNPVNLIAEKLHTDSSACPVGGVDFQGVAPDTEFITGKVNVISLIADLGQLA